MSNPRAIGVIGKNIQNGEVRSPVLSPMKTIFPSLSKKHYLFRSLKKGTKVQKPNGAFYVTKQKSKQVVWIHSNMNTQNLSSTSFSNRTILDTYSFSPIEKINIKTKVKSNQNSKKRLTRMRWGQGGKQLTKKHSNLLNKQKSNQRYAIKKTNFATLEPKPEVQHFFTPRVTKYNLNKKSSEKLDLQEFKQSFSMQKNSKNPLNTSTMEEFINRSQLEQLQKFKHSLQNSRLLYGTKPEFHKLSTALNSPQKKATIAWKSKNQLEGYSPWQQQSFPQIDTDYLLL